MLYTLKVSNGKQYLFETCIQADAEAQAEALITQYYQRKRRELKARNLQILWRRTDLTPNTEG